MSGKPKRPRPTVIRWERGGVVMVGTFAAGVWTFSCPRFPEIAAQHDGAADSAGAVADLERLTGTAPPDA